MAIEIPSTRQPRILVPIIAHLLVVSTLLQLILCPKFTFLFAFKDLRERAYKSHDGAAVKEEKKSLDGKDRTTLTKNDIRPLPPFPPNDVTRCTTRTRSSTPEDSGPLPPPPS